MQAFRALGILTLVFTLCPECVGDLTTIYVVRHAEKENETLDQLLGIRLSPGDAQRTVPLTAKGMARALALRALLRTEEVELAAVFSTRVLRTWQTAVPSVELIDTAGHSVSWYASVDELVARIEGHFEGKSILVVSHSGMVEAIVARLTSLQVDPIGNQYYNLFVVTLGGDAPRYERRTYGAAPEVVP